jgi:glycosyltransferase involved in cell wall biosynthesis
MPHCVPEWIFNASLDEQKTVDVFWVGACTREHYPLRAEIILGLSGGTVPGVSYEIHPYGMKCSDPLPGDCDQMRDRGWTLERLDAHQREYAARLRASKILAMDQSVYNGFVSQTFEAMACGCLVLSPLPHSAGPLGLVDGVNIVAIDSSNWRDKLRYYAEHDNERMEIVRRAYEHVHANHTCGARAAAIVRDLEALA